MLWKNTFRVGITAMAIASGCGVSFAEDIKIGVLMPISGGGASTGLPVVDGIKLAVKEINEAGGIDGRKIEILVRDTQRIPQVGSAAAKELIAKDGVKIIIGAATSGVSLAVSEIGKQEKVVIFNPTAKTNQLTGKNPHKFIFQLPSDTDVDSKRMVGVLNNIGAKKICLTGPDYAYTDDLFKGLKANIGNLVITKEYLVKLDTTDYSTLIGQLMGDSCDTVVGTIWGGGFIPFAKQAGPFGLFKAKKLVWGANLGSTEITTALKGAYPEGMWASATDVWYYEGTDAHKKFQAGLAALQGRKETDMYPISGYIAVQFLAAAIRKAKSLDAETIATALEGLTIDSPLGALTVDAKAHQVGAPEFYGPMMAVAGSDIKRMSPIKLMK